MRLPTRESESVEFKLSFDKETIESLAAFANAHGGSVYVGVDDSGKKKGVVLSKETVPQWINQIKHTTSPSIVPDAEIIQIAGKSIVVLTVPEYPLKPVACRGRYYKRIGNSNQVLSTTDVVNLHLTSVNTSWDWHLDPYHSLDDIDLERVAGFIDRVNSYRDIPITDSPLEVLRKLDLLRGDKISFACHLLFSPGDSLLRTIELGRFQDETTVKDALRLKCDLFTEVDEVMSFIRKHINKRMEFTGQPHREEKWEYPMESVREAIINAVVHRDYSLSADTVIKIFDDHIDMYNPGKLPDTLSIDKLLSNMYSSIPRNKQIADVFKAAGLIEKYGSGIKRIIAGCRSDNLPAPLFRESAGGFSVVLFNSSTPQMSPQKTPQMSPQKTPKKKSLGNRISMLIAHYPDITRKEIAAHLHLSEYTVKEYLAKLKADGRLIRKGSDRAGTWVVREKPAKYGHSKR